VIKIKCLDNNGYSTCLTVGKEYTVESTYDDIVRVICDLGFNYGFYQKRFKLVEKTKMKKGSKIKCIRPSSGLTLNKIYEVTRLDYDNDPYLVNDNGDNEMYYANRFEVVVLELDTLDEQIAFARTLIDKKVNGKHTSYVATKLEIFLSKDQASKSSSSVYGYFNQHGFCVAVGCVGCIEPVTGVKLAPESTTIELTSDYQAEVFKTEVKVGCQTISIEKVKEILTIAESL
jgi:hypothetical protein